MFLQQTNRLRLKIIAGIRYRGTIDMSRCFHSEVPHMGTAAVVLVSGQAAAKDGRIPGNNQKRAVFKLRLCCCKIHGRACRSLLLQIQGILQRIILSQFFPECRECRECRI